MGDDAGRSGFDRFVARLDYPMVVVTAAAGGRPEGCLVGFHTQCSMTPARFLVCLSKKNRTYRAARISPGLVVHLLAGDQLGLARLFGEETGDETDKFARCRWRGGPGGVPVLEGCSAWFAGAVVRWLDLGDHGGAVLEPLSGEASEADEGMIGFQAVKAFEPGHPA